MTSSSKRGVLLDIDGTLLDSNDAHAESWVHVLHEFGFDVPFDRVRSLIGEGGDKLIPDLTGLTKDSERGRKLTERRRSVFLERYLPNVVPFRDARSLVARLKHAGFTLALATSADDRELDALLATADVADLVSQGAGSTGKPSKPDADIVMAALDRASLRPSETLLVGDTPYDVEAAARAGVRTVALRCGGFSDASLSGAIAIYDDPHDLLVHFEDSPFGHARDASGAFRPHAHGSVEHTVHDRFDHVMSGPFGAHGPTAGPAWRARSTR